MACTIGENVLFSVCENSGDLRCLTTVSSNACPLSCSSDENANGFVVDDMTVVLGFGILCAAVLGDGDIVVPVLC